MMPSPSTADTAASITRARAAEVLADLPGNALLLLLAIGLEHGKVSLGDIYARAALFERGLIEEPQKWKPFVLTPLGNAAADMAAVKLGGAA